MEKSFAFEKLDERTGLTTGIMAAEIPDSDDEVFDYLGGGKADIQRWSDEAVKSTRAAGQEVSLGPIRIQHDPSKIGGKAVAITYDDSAKTITLTSQPVNAEARDLILRGFVRGYSICGGYRSRNCSECGADMMATMAARTNYCPQCNKRVKVKFVPAVVETSYVDSPALKEAVFTVIKVDGTQELRKFAQKGSDIMRQHYKEASAHHLKLSKHHKELAAHHSGLAKCAEGRADFASAKLHKDISAEHRAISGAHEAHAAHLTEMANNADAMTGEKVAKASAADDFFDRFIYGGPPAPAPAPSYSETFSK
jgi:DNA-directed RNA polymerase subunit RPC12/RpoP